MNKNKHKKPSLKETVGAAAIGVGVSVGALALGEAHIVDHQQAAVVQFQHEQEVAGESGNTAGVIGVKGFADDAKTELRKDKKDYYIESAIALGALGIGGGFLMSQAMDDSRARKGLPSRPDVHPVGGSAPDLPPDMANDTQYISIKLPPVPPVAKVS